jgi:hypothetical protein
MTNDIYHFIKGDEVYKPHDKSNPIGLVHKIGPKFIQIRNQDGQIKKYLPNQIFLSYDFNFNK